MENFPTLSGVLSDEVVDADLRLARLIYDQLELLDHGGAFGGFQEKLGETTLIDGNFDLVRLAQALNRLAFSKAKATNSTTDITPASDALSRE